MTRRRPGDKRRRLLARWGWLSLACTALVAGLVAVITRPTGDAVPAAGADLAGLTSILTKEVGQADVPLRFQEVTEAVGVDFRHLPGGRESLLPEDMGSGVACGDYDGDGWTDLFLVNFSGSVRPGSPLDEGDGRARLYRNLDGVRFEDVTDRAGVGLVAYGMGAAWGDYDNDGDLDLYVTAYGPNVLYENRGDGTFAEVTDRTGTGDTRFSAGCSWADYDRDGDLDLYVCNYVDFVYREQDRGVIERQYAAEQPYTLNPSSYPAQPNALYRNNGNGTFAEVAELAGVADGQGRSLSPSWVDLNNDGLLDLYVANDVSNNAVLGNNGDGTFRDVGPSSLAADYRGAMGIAAADLDNDLDLDLLITHWIAQENALYLNMTLDQMIGPSSDGRLWFMDEADALGFGQVSLDMVGWATGFADFDNDGRRDLWLVNGSTMERAQGDAGKRGLEPQRPFLFWHRGRQDFVDVAAQASDVLAQPMVGRGGAQADLDGDGLVDLIIVVHGGKARVLRNVAPRAGHWLRIDLRQTGGNTFALGARAYVTAGGSTQMAAVGCSSSYLSQDEHTLHFGLGPNTSVDSVRIVWPDGDEEVRRDPAVDRTLHLVHPARYPVSSEAGIEREPV